MPDANGTTDFSVLQNELKGKSTKIVLVAFDLLYLNGYDLRKLPLVERKAHLKKLIAETDIQFSESFEVDGPEMFAHACKVGLEGVVSKVRDSRYASGRGNDWVKKTCAQRETLPIAGFALEGKQVRRHLHRQARGRRPDLRREGRPRLRCRCRQGPAGAAEAADPEDPALRQADRAQGHLGGAGAAGGDRVPREVGRGQGAAPVLQRAQGGRMKPRDSATRSRELQDLRRLDPDGFLRKTFILPVEDARAQARAFIKEFPSGGYMTIVEQWRQLPDGQIQFTMRRLPTAD